MSLGNPTVYALGGQKVGKLRVLLDVLEVTLGVTLLLELAYIC